MIDSLLRYNTNAPRYTSYPPANLFQEAKSKEQVQKLWLDSNVLLPETLSFYFHIPFCVKRCLFCGCTSDTLHDESFRNAYFEALHQEMNEKLSWINKERKISQIHFGGGTPTSVPLVELEKILCHLKENFEFQENAEVAIEINPATLTEEMLKNLAQMGFNRVSYGVQDFDLEILKNIGRDPSLIAIPELLSLTRELGFRGINIDLVYGLPGQTEEGFAKTIEKAIEASSDRIALFSYAHVPWMRPEQKKLEAFAIPEAKTKMTLFLNAREEFLKAGYFAVGMDHFVKPSDALAKASLSGMLHRNFQGYCTRETTGQVYAFGASAISQFDNAYVQNIHNSAEYVKCIQNVQMTEIRAQELSYEQRVLRNVIERLMCNNRLKLSENEMAVISEGWNRLLALESEGLLNKLNENEIVATEFGSLVIRYLAMQLDPLMQTQKREGVFSQTI
jgi:oxygen-independent coproporphyrinogen-3 oxidase